MAGFNTAAVRGNLYDLQDRIVTGLEQVDGKKFKRDSRDRPEGDGCCWKAKGVTGDASGEGCA